MPQCAYANQFVYQPGSWSARASQRVVSPLLTFPRRKMFYAFLALFLFYFCLFIYFFRCSFPPWSSSTTTTPQFINNVFIYHENLFWN